MYVAYDPRPVQTHYLDLDPPRKQRDLCVSKLRCYFLSILILNYQARLSRDLSEYIYLTEYIQLLLSCG